MSGAAICRLVSVYDVQNVSKIQKSLSMPAVFSGPVRPDLVLSVHTRMAKNNRQPYAVSRIAGHQTSAESWGTGRAVARIPRVSGGGTPRSGQAAFGNMCRGGRMFAPTKVWRRWHVRINKRIRRAAVASSLAATAIPSLVMARGHRISNVPEFPLVIGNLSMTTTREATDALKALGAFADIEKVIESKTLRAGKGKMRNRRHRMRRGPLVVHNDNDSNIQRAFRNIPGVELCSVQRLNLLQLAPGGHLGRFVIWTEDAFSALDQIFGSHAENGEDGKTTAIFSRHRFSNPDLARILGSESIQAALLPVGPKRTKRPYTQKRNPLRNHSVMMRLNPYASLAKRLARRSQDSKKSKISKKHGSASPMFVQQLLAA